MTESMTCSLSIGNLSAVASLVVTISSATWPCRLHWPRPCRLHWPRPRQHRRAYRPHQPRRPRWFQWHQWPCWPNQPCQPHWSHWPHRPHQPRRSWHHQPPQLIGLVRSLAHRPRWLQDLQSHHNSSSSNIISGGGA